MGRLREERRVRTGGGLRGSQGARKGRTTGRKDEDGAGRDEVRERAEGRGRADGTNRKGLINGRWQEG